MIPDEPSPFAPDSDEPTPEPAKPTENDDDWRGPQDDPWQPDEQAPPPVIGD